MLVATPDANISQILNSYILHTTALPGPNNSSNGIHQEKIKHLHYLNDFRTQQCPLFLDHKCQSHRPFACFNWHFPNQRRRRPVKKPDGTFNYNPDVYCTSYDENTGVCPNGDDCQYVHRNAGDTERRYHPRYYKTGQCIYETTENGHCVKNGQHCAFAHGIDDLRQPVYDIREVNDAAEHIANLPATLEKERVLSEDPKWNDMLYVLAFYKTQMCKKPPRMCRQGYACPYYHNGKDRRRNPHSFRYRSTPCPQVKPSGDDWKDSSQCEAQDECAYCHTRTEQQFHPEIYKSTKCNDMIHEGFCPRGPFCAFAHGEGEANIGRDFLATPGLIEDLNRRHGSPTNDKDNVTGDDESSLRSVSPSSNNLLINASVSKNQLGIGMMGLSGLSTGTINYLHSLLSAQSQIIQQYAGVSTNKASSEDDDSSITPTQSMSATAYIVGNSSNKMINSSACSSDSGLSTTREDIPLTSQHPPPLIPPQPLSSTSSLLHSLPENDENTKYPYLNMILGSVLGDSFNAGSICLEEEEEELSERRRSIGAVGSERRKIDEDRICDEELDEVGPCSESPDLTEDVRDSIGEGMSSAGGNSITAPLNIPSMRPHYLSRWPHIGSSGASSGFGDSAPTGGLFPGRQQGNPLRGSSSTTISSSYTGGTGLPISSSGLLSGGGGGGSGPGNVGMACSPASSRLPQSPIMIQSPFNNAACDLEKLEMEKELSEVKGRLNETQRELSSMRHQRDVVLLQLQESWRLIQSLVGTNGGNGGEAIVGSGGEFDDKENFRQVQQQQQGIGSSGSVQSHQYKLTNHMSSTSSTNGNAAPTSKNGPISIGSTPD